MVNNWALTMGESVKSVVVPFTLSKKVMKAVREVAARKASLAERRRVPSVYREAIIAFVDSHIEWEDDGELCEEVCAVRLSAELGQSLSDYAVETDLTESELIRVAVCWFVRDALETLPAGVEGEGSEEEDEQPNMTGVMRLHLSDKDADLLEQWRVEAGERHRVPMVTKWLRSVLLRRPYLSEREILELRERNYQLLLIGRNLNQIAKALNTSLNQRDAELERVISGIKRQLDENRVAVGGLIDACVNRYA